MGNPLSKFNFPSPQGLFAAVRRHDIHTGIDLYCDLYQPVKAIESGTVVRREAFTGSSTGSPWWHDTECLVIAGKSGFILYGEIAANATVGQAIEEGQVIGYVLQVLKNNKGSPTTMLHLELYDRDMEPVVWALNEPQPIGLLDPTGLLIS